MTRTDSLVVGTLVVLLAVIAGLVGAPSLLPRHHVRRHASADPGPRHGARPIARASSAIPSRSARSARRPRLTATSSRSSSRALSGTARTGRSCPTSPTAGRSTRPARSGRSSCATTPAGTTASRSPRTTSRTPSTCSRTPPTPGPARRIVERGRPSRPTGPQTIVLLAQDAPGWVPPGGDPADRAGSPPGRRPGRPAGRRRRSVGNLSGRDRSRWPASTNGTPSSSRRRPMLPAEAPDDGALAARDGLARHAGPVRTPEPARPVPRRDRLPLLRRPAGARRRVQSGWARRRVRPVARR